MFSSWHHRSLRSVPSVGSTVQDSGRYLQEIDKKWLPWFQSACVFFTDKYVVLAVFPSCTGCREQNEKGSN